MESCKLQSDKLTLVLSIASVLLISQNSLAYTSSYAIWIVLLVWPLFFYLLVCSQQFKKVTLLSIAFGLGLYYSYSDVTESRFVWYCLLGLVSYFAVLFYLIVAMPLWYFRKNHPVWLLILFCTLWSLLEWLRSTLFGGFPWMLIGYVNMPHLELSQSLAVLGVFGVGFFTLFVMTSPALILLAPKSKSTWLAVMIAIGLVIVSYVYGVNRLHEASVSYWPKLNLSLIQTDFTNDERTLDKTKEVLKTITAVTQNNVDPSSRVVIWPEAAINQLYVRNADQERTRYNKFLKQISVLLPQHTVLLTGINVVDIIDVMPPEIISKSHGIGVIDSKMHFVDYHPKNNLVPFVEYVPLRGIINIDPLMTIMRGENNLDYLSSGVPGIIQLPNIPSFSPNICYDGLFSGNIINRTKERPSWILVVSNDSWFRNTEYVTWLSEMTRARAIEEGLPLIRVTNSGISSVIDPYGRILKILPTNTDIAYTTKLPKPIPVTFFGMYGNRIFAALMAIMMLGLLITYLTGIARFSSKE